MGSQVDGYSSLGDQALARPIRGVPACAGAPRQAAVFANGTIFQHVPASRDGKQRRKPPHLHAPRRCGRATDREPGRQASAPLQHHLTHCDGKSAAHIRLEFHIRIAAEARRESPADRIAASLLFEALGARQVFDSQLLLGTAMYRARLDEVRRRAVER